MAHIRDDAANVVKLSEEPWGDKGWMLTRWSDGIELLHHPIITQGAGILADRTALGLLGWPYHVTKNNQDPSLNCSHLYLAARAIDRALEATNKGRMVDVVRSLDDAKSLVNVTIYSLEGDVCSSKT